MSRQCRSRGASRSCNVPNSPSSEAQSYSSLEEAIRDWCVLITEEPAYSNALAEWQSNWNVEDFVYALAPVYATDPDYAHKIIATINANNLYRFDGWGDDE